MESRRFTKTCVYWRNGTCFKRDRCDFLHGFICYDDGKCTNSHCTKKHFKQRSPSTYLKGRRSWRGGMRKYSPRRSYSRSYSRSPGRSPRRSRSPYSTSRSRSPPYGKYSRKSRSRSPYGSPRHRSSRSPRRRSESPYSRRSRSQSHNRSPRKYSRSRSKTPSFQGKSGELPSEGKTPNGGMEKSGKGGTLGDLLGMKEDSANDIFASSDQEMPSEKATDKGPRFKPIEASQKDDKSSSAHDLSPSSKAINILENLPKEWVMGNKSSDKESSLDKSLRKALLKAIGKENEVEPSSISGMGPPPNPESRQDLWTPALSRNKGASVFPQVSMSSWEIDTPYVTRGRASQLIPQEGKPPELTSMPPPAAGASDTKVKVTPETSKRGKKRHRKRSSSSSSTSSTSSTHSSDSDDGKKKDKSSLDEFLEIGEEEREDALQKKKDILTRVWTLMGQKKKLELQKDEIVLNHKGDGKSLASLLQENNALSTEVDKQIFQMNRIVQLINEKLGISKSETQQQEFYLQPRMFNDTDLPKIFGKHEPNPSEKTLDKFLKVNDTKASPYFKHLKKDKSRSRSRSESLERKVKASKSEKERKIAIKKEKTPEEKQQKKEKKQKKQEIKRELSESKKKKFEEEFEYAPSPAMKPHIQYIDQGMHWCKVCNDFLDTLQEYTDHLQTARHLENLKSDPKKWMPQHPKIKKEPSMPGAPILTIPLKGLEFTHSLTSYYCSLCDTFMSSKSEAQGHPETKLHVSKYKDYLSANPMYETLYIKEKMAAYAKFIVEKERSKERATLSLTDTKKEVFFREVKNNTETNLNKVDATEQLMKESFASGCDTSLYSSEGVSDGNGCKQDSAASIRVCSRDRGAKQDSVDERKTSSRHHRDKEDRSTSSRDSSRRSKSEGKYDDLESESHKKKGLTTAEEEQLKMLKKKVEKHKESETTEYYGNGENQKSKLSNIMIGKMPFLKRNKDSQKNDDDRDTEEDKMIFSKDIPLPNGGQDKNPILPACVPKDMEYITEIQFSGNESTFIRKIGPMKSDGDDSGEMGSVSKKKKKSKKKSKIITAPEPNFSFLGFAPPDRMQLPPKHLPFPPPPANVVPSFPNFMPMQSPPPIFHPGPIVPQLPMHCLPPLNQMGPSFLPPPFIQEPVKMVPKPEAAKAADDLKPPGTEDVDDFPLLRLEGSNTDTEKGVHEDPSDLVLEGLELLEGAEDNDLPASD